MSWDLIVTIVIIALAGVYLLRKFTRGKKGGACGCGSDAGCCSGSASSGADGCDGSRHR